MEKYTVRSDIRPRGVCVCVCGVGSEDAQGLQVLGAFFHGFQEEEFGCYAEKYCQLDVN